MNRATITTNTIETNRLLLREITPEILKELHTTVSDTEIRNFLGLPTDDALKIEKEKFAAGHTMFDVSLKYFLMEDKHSGKIVGRCGFHTWRLQHARAELGYIIFNEQLKGKGYMKEALKAIVAFGFEQMHLNRIEAFTATYNTASKRLLKGLGFIEEGVLREHYCKDGKIEDSVCFSLLRREFLVLKHTPVLG